MNGTLLDPIRLLQWLGGATIKCDLSKNEAVNPKGPQPGLSICCASGDLNGAFSRAPQAYKKFIRYSIAFLKQNNKILLKENLKNTLWVQLNHLRELCENGKIREKISRAKKTPNFGLTLVVSLILCAQGIDLALSTKKTICSELGCLSLKKEFLKPKETRQRRSCEVCFINQVRISKSTLSVVNSINYFIPIANSSDCIPNYQKWTEKCQRMTFPSWSKNTGCAEKE